MIDLVLGTHNAKKLAELRELLPDEGVVRLRTLDDFPDSIDVAETGTTFQENARLKATEQARRLGRWVLAEDSGLSVVALDGAPGVYSARYSDPGATDARNNEKLLRALSEVPAEQRAAFYTCQTCLSDPEGKVRLETTGRCYGVIATEPSGRGGFGYDPLFVVPELHRTFGELGPAVKRAISHRARALRALVGPLRRCLEQEQRT